jgi:hypothetical protein
MCPRETPYYTRSADGREVLNRVLLSGRRPCVEYGLSSETVSIRRVDALRDAHAQGTLSRPADALSDLAEVFLGATLRWTRADGASWDS